MKIAFFSPYNVQCGIATHVEGIEKYLEDDDVFILAENLRGNQTETGSGKRGLCRCYGRGKGNLDIAIKKYDELKPDIMHICTDFGDHPHPIYMLKFMRYAKAEGTKIVCTIHTVPERSMDREWYVKFLNECDLIILNTPGQNVPIHGWMSEDKRVTHVPIGIPDPIPMRNGVAKEQIGLKASDKLILTTGFIHTYKNLISNVRVVRDIMLEHQDIHYIVVGHAQQTPDGEECLASVRKEMARSSNMKVVAKYMSIEELSPYYSAADVILCNYVQTRCSGSGNALMSLGYGVPIVSSKARMLDVLDDNTSIKVDVDDQFGLRRALIKALFDGELRSKLSQNCIEKYKRQSWREVSRLHREMYERLLNR